MNLALFDFDGTITHKDSLFDFLLYAVGLPKFIMNFMLLSPYMIAFKLKLMTNQKAKERVIGLFFKGYTAVKFNQIAKQYALNKIDRLVRPEAKAKLQWHLQQNDKVVIVSASIEAWLKPWCDVNGIELLATQLEIVEERISGRFLTKNCFGDEKVNRIKQHYDIKQYPLIYAYGDSSGDTAMLKLADKPFFRCFE
ncbi:MAG: HAD-IB family hydrolase [Gammaproteobacteria bacterium]|nr:HAD-IB family hydrolase [Gammaproteobacteria bacterium]